MAKKSFKNQITTGIDSLLQDTTSRPQKIEDDGFVKFNYNIKRTTHKALKVQSALEGRTMISILDDAINMYLSSKGVKE